MDTSSFPVRLIQFIFKRRCTTKVIDVLSRVFRQAADGARLLNHPFTVSLTLLTMLRSEINVAQAALEELNVDQRTLEKRVERLLDHGERIFLRPPEQVEVDFAHSYQEVSSTIEDLVGGAQREALALGNDYVGTEHLLLAIIREADASLSTILTHSGITHEATQKAIRKVLYS